VFKCSEYGDGYKYTNDNITSCDIDNHDKTGYYYVYANQYGNNDRTDYGEGNGNLGSCSPCNDDIPGDYNLYIDQNQDRYNDSNPDANIHLYNNFGIPIAGVHYDYCNEHQDGNYHRNIYDDAAIRYI
jgi:hypothetical protein